MDIKSKRSDKYKWTQAIAFALCVILFVLSLIGAGLSVLVLDRIEYYIGPEDILFHDNYRESPALQKEIAKKVDVITFHTEEHGQRLDKTVNETIEFDYDTIVIPELDQVEGFEYFATNGSFQLTNLDDYTEAAEVTPERFSDKPAYLIYDEGTLTKVPNRTHIQEEWMQGYDAAIDSRFDNIDKTGTKIYFSFDQSFLDLRQANFAAIKQQLLKWLPMTLVCGLLSIIAFIYLIVTTGRKDENGVRPIYKIDRIFTEIQLLIIGLFFAFGGAGFGYFLFESLRYGAYGFYQYYSGSSMIISVVLAAVIGLASAGLGLLFVLSCVRNLKSGRFIKNSIIYIVISSVFRGIRSIYHGGSVMTKVVLIVLGLCILSATIFGAVLAIILVLIFAPKWVRKYEQIKTGVDEVKNGNLSYKIPVDGKGELDELAKGINQISEASHKAIQNELKNQRLKTDLISNVSHDLKTPLTSIISYVDLLKKESLGSENAPKYLDVIDKKSMRLQKLTEDLFDAAKASSGAIPVKFEKVDMLSLINQGLGELADRIEASGLEFKLSAVNDKYYVRADGQLLWRVVENLLNNVLKYAQENSRVYIDIKELESINGKGPSVLLEIKNMSKTELNIHADELMERFKRGDESRTTEGSGLGLAIAKDLVRLQEGWFEIKIDGDLFKAIVMMPQYL